jgi:hypothetical protein
MHYKTLCRSNAAALAVFILAGAGSAAAAQQTGSAPEAGAPIAASAEADPQKEIPEGVGAKPTVEKRLFAAKKQLIWINHLSFLAGDPSVQTSFNAVNSGVGGGLSGLIIQSTSIGDTATPGGNKVVETGLQTPPGLKIKGVRVCYELSNARSFITQIRLSQLQNPPSSAIVRLDDATDQTNAGPICADSQATDIDPAAGAVRLDFRVNFGDVSDRIVLRGVGLYVAAI